METSIFVTDLAQQFSLSLVGPLTLLSFVSGWPEQSGADFLILGLSFLIGWCLRGAPSLSAGLPSTILDIFGGLALLEPGGLTRGWNFGIARSVHYVRRHNAGPPISASASTCIRIMKRATGLRNSTSLAMSLKRREQGRRDGW